MFKIDFQGFQNYCKDQLGLSEHSLRAYQQDLQAFVRFLSQGENSTEISAELLIQYHRNLREVVQSSPATIRRCFVTLKSYFRWLETLVPELQNPFDGLRLELKVPQRLPRPIDRPTLSALFKSTKHLINIDPELEVSTDRISSDQITGLIARLLVVTGMRIGEITHLKLKDVSGACTKIRVRRKGNRASDCFLIFEAIGKPAVETMTLPASYFSIPGEPVFLNRHLESDFAPFHIRF